MIKIASKLGKLSKKKVTVSFTSSVDIIFQLSILLMLKTVAVTVGKKDGHGRKKVEHDRKIDKNNQMDFQDYSKFHFLYRKRSVRNVTQFCHY